MFYQAGYCLQTSQTRLGGFRVKRTVDARPTVWLWSQSLGCEDTIGWIQITCSCSCAMDDGKANIWPLKCLKWQAAGRQTPKCRKGVQMLNRQNKGGGMAKGEASSATNLLSDLGQTPSLCLSFSVKGGSEWFCLYSPYEDRNLIF